MSNNGPRYQARPEAEHGCCHSAMVVDTTDLTRYGDEPAMVAECPDIETAILIAAALNRSAML